MLERLQKILSQAGITSRREAERFIVEGRVAVNGTVIVELGSKADPSKDRITLDGKPVTVVAEKLYILLYKPAGFVTTMKDPQGRPVVTDLVKSLGDRVFPVGRLDYNTEGLLLLTNDGEWANRLAHPRHEVDKEYHVRIRGTVLREQMDQLSAGVTLDDGKTAPAAVKVVKESDNNTWISITIHEGRYRQVRRMCEAVNMVVVRLKRVRYGSLGLGDLKPGEFRKLTSDEVAKLLGGNASSARISKERRVTTPPMDKKESAGRRYIVPSKAGGRPSPSGDKPRVSGGRGKAPKK